MNVNAIFDQFSDPILWVVTANSGSQQGGLLATFVSKASLVPDLPRFVIGIANHHFTWKLIEESRSFGLHVVGRDQLDWVDRFALQSGNSGVDKLQGLHWEPGKTGSPILTDSLLWMDCRVEASLDTGDRTLYVGAVIASGELRSGQPAHASEAFAHLTPEQKSTLGKQLVHDIGLDEAAIRDWRSRNAAHLPQ